MVSQAVMKRVDAELESERAAQTMKAEPFVKWAGGKRSLMPEILARVPEKFGRYFEPFLGGGALFFELRSSGRLPFVGKHPRAILNDANLRLMRTYRAIQGVRGIDVVEDVISRLRRKKNTEEAYYREREKFTDIIPDVDLAARFIFLNKTCFNGLYREGKKRQFNTPYGHNPKAKFLDASNLRACAWALGGDEAGDQWVRLKSEDFLYAVEGGGVSDGAWKTGAARKGDFVYFDPPYVPRGGKEFTNYVNGGFGPAEHLRLRNLALVLKKRGVSVLLSNSGADLVRELYGDSRAFTISEVKGKRSIGPTSAHRTHAPDVLIW